MKYTVKMSIDLRNEPPHSSQSWLCSRGAILATADKIATPIERAYYKAKNAIKTAYQDYYVKKEAARPKYEIIASTQILTDKINRVIKRHATDGIINWDVFLQYFDTPISYSIHNIDGTIRKFYIDVVNIEYCIDGVVYPIMFNKLDFNYTVITRKPLPILASESEDSE